MLPTRLLELSSTGTRLRLGKELKGPIKYATLSHCWGSLSFTTLNEANVAQFLQNIPHEILPRTFQDAIEIALYLGFKYLWIDSLCIIQDSTSDWNYESSLMTSVYGRSTLNIAASGAVDGSTGCFIDCEESWRCLVKEKSTEAGKSRILMAYADEGQEFPQRMVRMPLWNRAWAVQERILPRRTIFFTTKEVFWECDNGLVCETFPNVGHVLDSHGWGASSRRSMTLHDWMGFVYTYATCALTKSQDKLVAISGIAKLIHKQIEDEYIVGLWRQDLEYQLLWTSNGCHRPQKYRAPSWSWAALDGSVALSGERRWVPDPLAISIEDISIQYLLPGNPFGEVLSAKLRIRCDYLICGSVRRNPPSIKIVGHSEVLASCHNTVYLDASNDVAGFDPVSRFKDVFILPIVYDNGKNWGLLLEVAQDSPRLYRRVGTARIRLHYNSEGEFALTSFYQRVIGYQAKDTDYAKILEVENGKTLRFIDLI
jgi:Heterokaryon incompatibility protein (HET)